MPIFRAIERVDQCVASVGFDSRVFTMTASTMSSVIVRGAPGRGSSSSPSGPCSRNRLRHLPTVRAVSPRSVATALLERPSAALSTMRARCASACAVLGRRTQRVSVCWSSPLSVSSVSGRPLAIGILPVSTTIRDASIIVRTSESVH